MDVPYSRCALLVVLPGKHINTASSTVSPKGGAHIRRRSLLCLHWGGPFSAVEPLLDERSSLAKEGGE